MAWSEGSEGSVFAGLAGLGLQMDAIPEVRDRLKDLQCLMVEKPAPGESEVKTSAAIAKTHSNLRHNALVMRPLLKMMSQHQDKTPCKEALCTELKVLFERARLSPDIGALSDEAWSIKYMYGLVKQLTYKSKPPRDTWQILLSVFFLIAAFFLKILQRVYIKEISWWGIAISKDPLFQELLGIWGVSCTNWTPKKPAAKSAASPVQASTASESPSPAVGKAKGSGKDCMFHQSVFLLSRDCCNSNCSLMC